MPGRKLLRIVFALLLMVIVWNGVAVAASADHGSQTETAIVQRYEDYMTLEEGLQELRNICKEFRQGDSFRMAVPTSDFDDVNEPVAYLLQHYKDHTNDPKEGEYLALTFAVNKTIYVSNERDGYYTYDITVDGLEGLNGYSIEDEKAVDNRVEEILAELKLDGKSSKEKALAIEKYIRKNVKFCADEARQYTPAAAFIDNKACGQSIALMFYRLAMEAGLDCRIVTNDLHGQIWNIVQMDDGKYYHMECTWDLDQPVPYFVLRGSKSWEKEHVSYMEGSVGEYISGYLLQDGVAVETLYDIPEYDVAGELDRGYFSEGLQWIYLQGFILEIAPEEGVEKAEIPDGPNQIWPYIGTYIEELRIAEGITRVGSRAFPSGFQVRKLSLPDSLVSIGAKAFENGIVAERITIPQNVKIIEEEAFFGCHETEVLLPESLTKVDGFAFYGNFELKKVIIEGTDIEWGDSVFGETALKSLGPIGSDCDVEYASIDTLTDDSFPELCNLVKFVTCPEIKSIPSYYMSRWECLEEVVLSEGLETIEDNAFDGCVCLKTVSIPSTVTRIGNDAFDTCYELTGQIYLSKNLQEMGYAFPQSHNITEFVCEAPCKPNGWDDNWKCLDVPVRWAEDTPIRLNGISFSVRSFCLYAKIYCTVDEAYLGNVNFVVEQGEYVHEETVYDTEVEISAWLSLNQMGKPFEVYAYRTEDYLKTEKTRIPLVNADDQSIADNLWKFSFEEYVEKILQGDCSEETKQVANSLLEYAHCLGAYFEGTDYEAEGLTTPYLEGNDMVIEGDLQEPWKYLGMSLYYGQSYIYSRLYFQMDLELEEVEEMFASYHVTKKGEGYYSIGCYAQINKLDKVQEINLIQNGKSITYRFSALTYFEQAFQVTQDVKLRNLLCATYDLYISCQECTRGQ